MIKKILFFILIISSLSFLFIDLKKDNFLEGVKNKYSIIEKYAITLGSSNHRALFINYYINSNIYNKSVEECFEYTKDYAVSYKTKNKKASNVKEIYIRFTDPTNNFLEYSSYYYTLGSTIYIDNENKNKIDNFTTWNTDYRLNTNNK